LDDADEWCVDSTHLAEVYSKITDRVLGELADRPVKCAASGSPTHRVLLHDEPTVDQPTDGIRHSVR
jgi:hypothetical protein